MASVRATKAAAAQTREWILIIPDHAGVLSRRIAIRPQHSPNFARYHKEGYVSWAGPLFTQHVYPEHGRRPFKGSALVLNDSSIENSLNRLTEDVYVKEKIWDLEKAIIQPFRTLIRKNVKL